MFRFELSSYALRAVNPGNFYGIVGCRSQAPNPVKILCVLGVLSNAGGYKKMNSQGIKNAINFSYDSDPIAPYDKSAQS